MSAGFSLERQRVLELGFGSGDLLFLFSTSCTLMGTELSQSAVDAIEQDPRLTHYHDTWFRAAQADGTLPSPPVQADILINSHMLEHVPDDRATLADALPAVASGGLVVTFVPLEPPGFDPKHVRTYSPHSLRRLMEDDEAEAARGDGNLPRRWGLSKGSKASSGEHALFGLMTRSPDAGSLVGSWQPSRRQTCAVGKPAAGSRPAANHGGDLSSRPSIDTTARVRSGR